MKYVRSSVTSEIVEKLEILYNSRLLAALTGLDRATITKYHNNRLISPEDTCLTCLHKIIKHFKAKHEVDGDESLYLAQVVQKIKTDRLTEELKLIELQKQRQELIDKEEFTELLQPFFNAIADGLIALSRNYPETESEIKVMLKTWSELSFHLENLATENVKNFVESKKNQPVTGLSEEKMKLAEETIHTIELKN